MFKQLEEMELSLTEKSVGGTGFEGKNGTVLDWFNLNCVLAQLLSQKHWSLT